MAVIWKVVKSGRVCAGIPILLSLPFKMMYNMSKLHYGLSNEWWGGGGGAEPPSSLIL